MTNPHAKLEAELAEHQAILAIAQGKQRSWRELAETQLLQAQSDLADLDAEIRPALDAVKFTQDELARRQRYTLAPWKIDRKYRWGSGYRYVANEKEDWTTDRVWLRVVSRQERRPEPQWEVQIDGAPTGTGRITIVYGAPAPGDNELDKYLKIVDAKLIEIGFYLVEATS